MINTEQNDQRNHKNRDPPSGRKLDRRGFPPKPSRPGKLPMSLGGSAEKGGTGSQADRDPNIKDDMPSGGEILGTNQQVKKRDHRDESENHPNDWIGGRWYWRLSHSFPIRQKRSCLDRLKYRRCIGVGKHLMK